MLKYTDTEVVFSEIPDEVTLAVNISNCQHRCKNCHSPYLRENVGHELTPEAIDELIEKNDGITCFCFMGEGNDEDALKNAIFHITLKHPDIKIGLYSGREKVTESFVQYLTYLKVGPYKEEFGPLNKETTNQRLYVYDSGLVNENARNGILPQDEEFPPYGFVDITHKFWK